MSLYYRTHTIESSRQNNLFVCTPVENKSIDRDMLFNVPWYYDTTKGLYDIR